MPRGKGGVLEGSAGTASDEFGRALRALVAAPAKPGQEGQTSAQDKTEMVDSTAALTLRRCYPRVWP